MTTTASDVISQTDVRAIAEKIRNQKYQNRRAFRDHDAQDINSNDFEFPVLETDLDGEAVEVPEGSNYPRGSMEYDDVRAVYTKYGVEIAIPDEKVEDNVVDIVLDGNEDLIRAEENRIDFIAYQVLSSNASGDFKTTDVAGSAIGDDDGTFVWEDIATARQEAFLRELDLSQVELYVSGQNITDFINMEEFTQASEMGDQVLQQGVLPGGDMLGEQALLGVAGDIPVYSTNTGDYDEGEGYLVDRSNFGWESTRDGMDVDSYREEDKEQDVFRVRGRWDWVATQPTAAIPFEA